MGFQVARGRCEDAENGQMRIYCAVVIVVSVNVSRPLSHPFHLVNRR